MSIEDRIERLTVRVLALESAMLLAARKEDEARFAEYQKKRDNPQPTPVPLYQVGDLVEVVSDDSFGYLCVGERYRVQWIDGDGDLWAHDICIAPNRVRLISRP
jgi:hypothetical protein